MAFFPGRQRAKPSSRNRRSGGGSSRGRTAPTPLKTSPALDPELNKARMEANKKAGLGDSFGRSRGDPNFGKGFVAPKAQFRDSRGGALIKQKVKPGRKLTRQEFQQSLARKQVVSRAARKFLRKTEEKRIKSGAAERRRRIDALTAKQILVKQIEGFPLTELGRKDKQAVIDFIDRQFEPFFGRKKALFTTSMLGKIEKNLGKFIRKKGTKEIPKTRKLIRPIQQKSKPLAKSKKPVSVIRARVFKTKEATALKKRVKGLAGVRQVLSESRGEALVRQKQGSISGRLGSVAAVAALGSARGILGIAETIRNPIKTAKAQISALRQPVKTFRFLKDEFILDPVGMVAEFYTFGKGVNLLGKGVKKSPVGRYVQEELFIRSQPKQVQSAVRKILRAARVQEKINPLKIKALRKVDFLDVKALNKIEADALVKTLKQTDSVVFGSWAARTLGGKKLPKPKDVDLATANVDAFNKAFIKNLPKSQRNNYVVSKQKIFKKVKSISQASDKLGAKKRGGFVLDPILDVKPIGRLIPQKSLFTGRGQIPAVGYVRKIKAKVKFDKILKINRDIKTNSSKIKSLFKKKQTKAVKKRISDLKKRVRKLEKQRAIEFKKFSPSDLAKIKKVTAVGQLEFPTQKIVTVGGIKVIGFGEQTVRKALGTLSVLIEKSARRAKDPKSLLIALEVQRAALKSSKKLTPFKKRKLKILDDAIRLLKSKSFAKLLEKKVPGLTKEFPLVAKISAPKLKKVNFAKIRKDVLKKLPKAKVKPKPIAAQRERQRRAKTFNKFSTRKRTSKFKKLKSKVLPKKKKKFTEKDFFAEELNVIRQQAKFEVERFEIFSGKKLPKKTRVSAIETRFNKLKKEIIRERNARKPVKAPKKRVVKKKVAKQPRKKRVVKKASKLVKSKKSSKLPSSKLRTSKSSKLSTPPNSRLKASKASKVVSGKPSKLTTSKIKPSKTPKAKTSKLKPGKPSKLKPSKLRPSKVPRGTPSRLTPSKISRILERLPKGAPKPPPRILRKPRTKKEEERVIKWFKEQKQIYRPSLAAVLFNITGIPKKKLTGFEIRPLLVRTRKTKSKKPKKRKRLKRKASSRKKKK